MLSSPKLSASTTNATSSTTAARTRISAVVSCSRVSTPPSRIERPVKTTTSAITTTREVKSTSSTMRPPVLPPEVENSRESSTTAAKSATEDAAIVVWPMSLSARPASLRTGTISPSEVAARVIASSSGLCTQPTAPNPTRPHRRAPAR
jgi:hypothetical protein